jgi:hypothetical protein
MPNKERTPQASTAIAATARPATARSAPDPARWHCVLMGSPRRGHSRSTDLAGVAWQNGYVWRGCRPRAAGVLGSLLIFGEAHLGGFCRPDMIFGGARPTKECDAVS